MGNALFQDDPEVVEDNKETKVKLFRERDTDGKYGYPFGACRLMGEHSGPPLRGFGKRAIAIRPLVGMDLGQVDEKYGLYFDGDKVFRLNDCAELQDIGPGIRYLKELDLSKNYIGAHLLVFHTTLCLPPSLCPVPRSPACVGRASQIRKEEQERADNRLLQFTIQVRRAQEALDSGLQTHFRRLHRDALHHRRAQEMARRHA